MDEVTVEVDLNESHGMDILLILSFNIVDG